MINFSPETRKAQRRHRTSRQRLECAELAPAFGLQRDAVDGKSAGKPDALQMLRAICRQGAGIRASVWSARSLLPLSGCNKDAADGKSAGKPDALQTLRAICRHGDGTSRQRLECAELAPAFGLQRDAVDGKSAGKPDALQTLREVRLPLAPYSSHGLISAFIISLPSPGLAEASWRGAAGGNRARRCRRRCSNRVATRWG